MRYHPDVDLDEVHGLAALMTLEDAPSSTFPTAAPRAASPAIRRSCRDGELERLTRRFIDEIIDRHRPRHSTSPPPTSDTDAAGDGVDHRHLRKITASQPGVVTGKPVELCGSPGREEATGRGVHDRHAQDAASDSAATLADRRRHPGLRQRRLARRQVARTQRRKVVAVSDVSGGDLRPERASTCRGCSPTTAAPARSRASRRREIIQRGAAALRRRRPDPRRPGGVITRDERRRDQGARHHRGRQRPDDPEADDILARRGVLVLPDILANAGGVTVSYFEWVQDLDNFFWTETRSTCASRKRWSAPSTASGQPPERFEVDPRTAAYILAVERIMEARSPPRPVCVTRPLAWHKHKCKNIYLGIFALILHKSCFSRA